LSFVNIYFLNINGKLSTVQVGKQAGWQGKWTESCSIFGRTCLPPPRPYIKRKLPGCYLALVNTHLLRSVCISCGQFTILCRRFFVRYFADILNYFKMPARWNDETTYKFVQLYRENECLRNIHTCNISFIHSCTSAYSSGWTFGLPFRGFLITHIQNCLVLLSPFRQRQGY
jgi:hypothetical protein